MMSTRLGATVLPLAPLLLDAVTTMGPSLYGPSPWLTANERHRPFLALARQGLDSSIFPGALRRNASEVLEAAHFGAVPAGRAADLLWQTLALDYFASVPGTAASYHPEKGLLEFRCPASALTEETVFFPDRLEAIGKFLNLPYALFEQSQGEAVVRIPTLSFLEAEANRLGKAVAFGGGGSAEWSYFLGEILRDDFNGEHLEGRQPIALPLTWIYLSHARDAVHPFIFAKHDVYHAVLVAMLPAPLRHMAAGLYIAVGGLPPELRGLSFVEPMMDFLSDKEIPRGRMDDLMDGAFLYLREDIRRHCVSDLHRRFLAELSAAWAPYVHESRRDSVASYLRTLLS